MDHIPYELIARYLAGECTDSEKQQIRAWSEKHPQLMEEYTSIWQKTISPAGFNPDVEHALRKVNARIDEKEKTDGRQQMLDSTQKVDTKQQTDAPQKKKKTDAQQPKMDTQQKKIRSKRLYLFAACAAAAVLVFISIITIRMSDSSGLPYNTDTLLALTTGTAETREYTLPDGSTISLNQSSTLRYPEVFTGDTREVYLEGEAFFDITPDAAKPFIIHANNTITRVVGTSFGVRAVKGEEKVVVTVATGIINLSAEGKKEYVEVKQGEQGFCLPKENVTEKYAQPDPNLLAWKTKILVFKQSPMSEVVKVIENTYHTPIHIDESISGLQLTSTLDKRSLEDIIQIIEMTLSIQSEQTENGILLTAE